MIEINSEILTCAYCQHADTAENMTIDPDGDPICYNCFNDHFFICHHCDAITRNDDEIIVNGHFSVCLDCSLDYPVCDHCEQHITRNHVWANRNLCICRDCSDEYEICEECGNIVQRDSIYWSDDDYPYCRDCYQQLGINLIHSYNFKPDPIFYGHNSYPFRGYGVELEIDGGNMKGAAAKDLMAISDDHFYLKYDGSLSGNGIEIVTHPATLDYHSEYFPWNDLLNVAIRHGYRSHDTNTCGLHIHASRTLFGKDWVFQEFTIAKVMLLIDFFWKQYIVPFSRRNYEKLEQWAKKPDTNIMLEDTEDQILEKVKCQKYRGRYQAVNLENENTVEFRFFRGTLTRDTIIAAIQFLDVLINYAKRTELKHIYDKNFMEIFGISGYSELTNYVNNIFIKGGK